MRSNDTGVVAMALVAWVGACIVFGLISPDFGHLRHPVALLGAIGEPNALAFNLLGFVAPGLALAWLAWRWRSQQAADGWRARIGLQLLLLSALAFVAQGLLPLDPTDLLAPASRAHAVAWSAWWLAFVAGGLLVGAGHAGRTGIALALLVLLLAMAGASLMPPALAQRLAFAGWFGWWLWAGRVSRASPSGRG